MMVVGVTTQPLRVRRALLMLAAATFTVMLILTTDGQASGEVWDAGASGPAKDGDSDAGSELSVWAERLDPRRRLPAGRPLYMLHSVDRQHGDDRRPPPDACPELFAGHSGAAHAGWLSWRDGHCPSIPPLHELITVLMVDTNASRLSTATAHITAVYPNMTVLAVHHLATRGGTRGGGPGAAWNRLAGRLRTKYALLARGLTLLTAEDRLRRLVALLSLLPAVSAAGGAVRSSDDGRWRLGCWQARLSPYQLQLTEGYELSAPGECVLCDTADGPLLVRSSQLRQLPLHDTLPERVLFTDWLLRLRSTGALLAVCPDVMFYTVSVRRESATTRHRQWRHLAKHWELNVVQLSASERYLYTCSEVAATCSHPAGPGHYLTPPCCYRQLKTLLTYLSTLLSRYRAPFWLILPERALMSGSVSLQPPCRSQIDVISNFSGIETIQKHVEQLHALGFHVAMSGLHYVWIRTPDFFVNVRGQVRSSDTDGVVTTFTGVTLPVVSGAGPGNGTGRGSQVRQCPRQRHHACCDQLTPDDDQSLFQLYRLYVR